MRAENVVGVAGCGMREGRNGYGLKTNGYGLRVAVSCGLRGCGLRVKSKGQ